MIHLSFFLLQQLCCVPSMPYCSGPRFFWTSLILLVINLVVTPRGNLFNTTQGIPVISLTHTLDIARPDLNNFGWLDVCKIGESYWISAKREKILNFCRKKGKFVNICNNKKRKGIEFLQTRKVITLLRKKESRWTFEEKLMDVRNRGKLLNVCKIGQCYWTSAKEESYWTSEEKESCWIYEEPRKCSWTVSIN